MEADEIKKESNVSTIIENKDYDDVKSSVNGDCEPATNININPESSDVDSRRSSVSLDDEDESKRNKRRKDKEDHSRKDDYSNRSKDEHARVKEEHGHKKDDHPSKKEDHNYIASRNKSGNGNSASPKSQTLIDSQEIEEGVKNIDSPGPKVPPLKIVIPSVETEQGSRNGKCAARHHGGLPYVVVSNDETTAASTITTSPTSPVIQSTVIKEDAHSPLSAGCLLNEDQRVQQRVLRSTHSRGTASISSGNGCSSGNNSSVTSGNSSPVAPDLSPQQDILIPKDENNLKTKVDSNSKGKSENISSRRIDTTIKVKTELEDEKTNVTEARNPIEYHNKEHTITVELHPRKRKLKSKQESSHSENDHLASFGTIPHPHEVPVTNCYQMFMDIRRQIDLKRKGLFPIQPKPPQGFKDYLMNRCTYTLAGNSVPRLKRRNAEPLEGISEGMKELYQEQESERYSLRMQHVIEKEKLVLSVEQEILRVHGRAARALANQALPFSACTILKDEEVYNVITPEQEEKDRNARSRYNGRLFISWLQDVDDKWEKIKEEMLDRHHKEAESLNAIQKFNWDLKMRHLGLWKCKKFVPVDETLVPMISVSDDFDLLPE